MLYGRWILLAVVLLAAGFCYSCGMDQDAAGRAAAVESVTSDTALETIPETVVETVPETVMETAPLQICYVHVCGEVTSPGVYQLLEGSRVYEAVEAAGGFTQDAASEYLNLAETVQDGMKIVVPDRESEMKPAAAGIYLAESSAAAGAQRADSGTNGGILGGAGGSAGGKVNINTADSTALMTLSGIGEARAAAIIQYREEHGKFSSIEEIMQVPGIKEAAFQKIKQNIEI
jgi:competence protein ComEA